MMTISEIKESVETAGEKMKRGAKKVGNRMKEGAEETKDKCDSRNLYSTTPNSLTDLKKSK